MKKQLLVCALAGTLMTACQQEADVQPNTSTLANEVAGTYRTNVYLDPSGVAILAEQMPFTELKAESDSSVTLVYTSLYPVATNQLIEHVTLSRQSNGIQLQLSGSRIGTLETDRIFTDNGMEKQGKLLRISLQRDSQSKLNFAGFK